MWQNMVVFAVDKLNGSYTISSITDTKLHVQSKNRLVRVSNQSGLLSIILGRGCIATVNVISRTFKLVQDTLHLLISALEIAIDIAIT